MPTYRFHTRINNAYSDKIEWCETDDAARENARDIIKETRASALRRYGPLPAIVNADVRVNIFRVEHWDTPESPDGFRPAMQGQKEEYLGCVS